MGTKEMRVLISEAFFISNFLSRKNTHDLP